MFFDPQGSNYNLMIEKSVRQTVEQKYQENNTAAMKTFDLIQEGVSFSKYARALTKIFPLQLECCGVDGPKSWAQSTYNNYDFQGHEVGIASAQHHYIIPRSCFSTDCSNSIKLAQQQGLNGNALNTQVCP